ncbi:glycosyltransferase [Mycolicibacterium novocastrense]|uniref:Glycosyl transferase, UDP-glucuronosyltransferase n=1 Tax=Mycolicibacterium novocastrense TaxID=59813 RepID=A0AAW5SJR8_MYCNV|nr:glycosyltransferase [Mycolicibacterium novocastrense]MCV7023712.1 glycosyltransferase [Mycolicibacterium novocastrense]GAT11586.1 glycosyl transferase, UDP-glucuronosyltransferase [Mycolicibacterium novocastrense]
MKFVLAFYGSRGDVEPCVAVGRELLCRGHDVRLAVSPNLVEFVESAGLTAAAFGPDARTWQELHRDFMMLLFRNFWRVRELIKLAREDWNLYAQFWKEANTTLTSLAEGADLLFADAGFDQPAANVAEYFDIPLATLHTSPLRAHSELVPKSSPLIRVAMTLSKWLGWRLAKRFEDAQRRELGLPKATRPSSERIAERGSLEIQAYDEACFPGLASNWAENDRRRPLVGALTVELPAEADEEAASWIATGPPPIFFGFGSMPVQSPADTLAMIGAACAELGERALVCAAGTDFTDIVGLDHLKVVDTLNFAAIFPSCRAVVHHGGTGTTAAGLRAGVPSLILWTWLDQALWGAQVKRLKVGTSRRLSSTTRESLLADLRAILAPDCVAEARDFAAKMTKPAESAANAAERVEAFARVRRIG